MRGCRHEGTDEEVSMEKVEVEEPCAEYIILLLLSLLSLYFDENTFILLLE